MKEQARAAAIAAILGITAFLAVEAYHQVLLSVENFLFSRDDGHLVPIAASLPLWKRALSPALGGLVAGFILWLYPRFSERMPHAGHAGDYLDAIRSENGRFDTPACLAKMTASLCVVATGSAIGREGAMILLAALSCSLLAQIFTPEKEWKLWTACGVAAGMATAYNAPIAGSIFIAEIFWGQFAPRAIWPVAVAAFTAVTALKVFNVSHGPLYAAAVTMDNTLEQYAVMLLTGLAAGMFGPFYLWSISSGKRLFQKTGLPIYLRLALGGAVAGTLSMFYPQVWGNGASIVESLLTSEPGKLFIIGLFLCKFLAIVGCNASGAPGGIFTPTMFMGAALGAFLSMGLSHMGLFQGHSALMAASGMACTLAAVSRAPFMAAFIVCEFTGQYDPLPGLLVCALVADTLARRLGGQSIYGD